MKLSYEGKTFIRISMSQCYVYQYLNEFAINVYEIRILVFTRHILLISNWNFINTHVWVNSRRDLH